MQKILERGEKGKTYTVEEIKELMDAYIKGAEQEAVAARPSERVVLTFYIRTVIISERNKIRRFCGVGGVYAANAGLFCCFWQV